MAHAFLRTVQDLYLTSKSNFNSKSLLRVSTILPAINNFFFKANGLIYFFTGEDHVQDLAVETEGKLIKKTEGLSYLFSKFKQIILCLKGILPHSVMALTYKSV